MLGNLWDGLNEILGRPQTLDRFGNRLHNFYKLGRLGRGNPRKVNPAGFYSHEFDQVCKQRKLAAGVIITFQVMAFAGMSSGHPNPVGTLSQSRQKKLGAHPSGAGNSDDTDVGGVLKTADTRQIGRTVTAPAA